MVSLQRLASAALRRLRRPDQELEHARNYVRTDEVSGQIQFDLLKREGLAHNSRLLEIGCGSAAYIRYAATRNPELTALGLELQPDAAALARNNVERWKLTDRVTIEVGDVLQRAPEAVFDVATLHQNIYYFPMDGRVGTLRHVRAFLKPGGRLLLTTVCLGRGAAVDVLNLWGAMTEGCGRLPTPAEMVAQMEAAGFTHVTKQSLIPSDSFYALVGSAP